MTKHNQKHGGKRLGSGRKSLFGEPLVTLTATVTKAQKALFKRLGGSKWLRKILDETMK